MKADTISPPEETAGTRVPHHPSRPNRILVVDEDSDLRLLYADVLTGSDYCVDAAEDGAAAWGILKSKRYNLLITDNNMPNLSGVELLKKVHAARMALPVIMATGTLPQEEFTRHPWLQPAATLVKPYTVADLLGTVNEVLQTTNVPHEHPLTWPDLQPQPSAEALRLC